jgi:tRNA/tmRNA/rRNA uracil-C5-methylase (TrmA/RlmC/RlmD family)
MTADPDHQRRADRGATVELRITDVAFGGSGIARSNGKAVFVPFTIDGELVSARITRHKKQFAEAEVVELLDESPHRAVPQCPYFGRCGGCAYQHIDYEQQLAIKSRQVADVLRRIGKLRDVPMQPIIPSPEPYGYRNRITVHAQDGVVGFYRRDAHELIDVTHCPISRPEVNDELAQLRSQRLRDGHYALRGPGGTRAVGSPSDEDDTAVVPPARVFTQTNDAVAHALRELVASFFPERGALLIDAFCGTGFFAKRLAGNFDRVIGIEWDRFAVEAARSDAAANETYIAGDVEIELRELAAARGSTSELHLIVDPPATGLTNAIRQTILDLAPQTLVYVSCNPATLARDLGRLQSQFRIVSVTPLDMFPQTAEIEVAVHLALASEKGLAANGSD